MLLKTPEGDLPKFRRLLALVVSVALWLPLGTVQAQTLGAVEQRIGRLEEAVRKLERRTGKGTGEQVAATVSVSPSVVADQLAAIVALNARLAAVERMLAEMIAGQEQDRRNLAVGLDQLQRLKGDAEARLEGVEQQVAALVSAPKAEPVLPSPAKVMTADDRFLEALDFVEKGEWSKAEFAFDTFVANNPGHPRVIEARYWFGRSLLGGGKPAPAAQVFLELFEKHPGAPIALDNLFFLAEALVALGPESAGEACAVYGQIEGDFAGSLSTAQRERLLDQRVKLNCK